MNASTNTAKQNYVQKNPKQNGISAVTMAEYLPHYVVRNYVLLFKPSTQQEISRTLRKFRRRHKEQKKPALVLTTLCGFYARKNPHVTEKQCTLEISYGKVPLRQRGTVTIKRLADSDPSSEQSGHWVRIGGFHLESLLLTVAEAAGRGGILSLIWSRYFASENPLILCVGECALNTARKPTNQPVSR